MTDPLTKHQDILRGEQIFRAMLNKARSDTIKAGWFDAMEKAHRLRTGEFMKIQAKALAWGKEEAERPARERIEARRKLTDG